VGEIHKNGMYVIIDWVANHTAWDNPWTKEHPEWYSKDSNGNFMPPMGTDWTDVIQLDLEHPGQRQGMIDAMKFWLTETDIDGFRCDVAWNIPVEFWNQVRNELEAVKPVFMLAEAEDPEHHVAAYDMSYGWTFHHLMNEIAKGNRPITAIDAYMLVESRSFPGDSYRMHFTSNHDENSWNGTEYERLGDGALTFAVLSATIPGMPLIYTGQEEPVKRRLEFFEKDTIEWKNLELEGFYKQLLDLKHKNPALWNGQYGGDFIRIENTAPDSVYSFYRELDNNRVLVLLNLSDSIQEFRLNRSKKMEAVYRNWFTGNPTDFKEDTAFKMAPWDYAVLVQ
jgi:glycosidase